MKFQKMMVFLLATVLCLALAACGGAESETSGSTSESKPGGSSSSATQNTVGSSDEGSKEVVLVENDDIIVKVTGTEQDDLWGYTMKVFLENKTDKELMFSVDDVSVNGYMCDPFWASTVAAGKKANEKITFSDAAFAENGSEAVEEISFTLHVYDSNDLMADSLIQETFTVNP